MDLKISRDLPVLLSSPPFVNETGNTAEELAGAGDKSRKLSSLLEKHAKKMKVGFFDAATVAEPSPVDGFHLDRSGHAQLGNALAPIVRKLISQDSTLG